ncbi:MAG: N-formylglutamate deformylase [Gammaproteobacteria bacterium]|nr:N-formylglutamate deformylase [Gammaproteobacteria bacterium]
MGDSPLLVSIPHDGHLLAPGMAARMTSAARALPDSDWHVRRLYEFARTLDASFLVATYSRYVVDLNRPPSDASLYDGQVSTGLCPRETFAGDRIYVEEQDCTEIERRERVKAFWKPYHSVLDSELLRIRDKFGYALLWDAHSIRSEIPNLFIGKLPDLNIGTNNGATCHSLLERKIVSIAESSRFSWVLNGRFKGGYITRTYGTPAQKIHAMQLELSQKCYMNEDTLLYDEHSADKLIHVLKDMLKQYMQLANTLH